jgi:hypothetical protein
LVGRRRIESVQTLSASAFLLRLSADYYSEVEGQMSAHNLTRDRLRDLASALSERDWAIIREVVTLRFVSANQLGRLCFASQQQPTADVRAARRALLRLHRLGLVDRLPRSVGGVHRGSTGFIYCLGIAGQRLSMERGWMPTRRARSVTPGRLFIRHALAVAELHTRLVEAEQKGSFELLDRVSEPTCWRKGGGTLLKPDSYLRLGVGAFEDSYFIEVDLGTEGSWAIEQQLKRYLAYHQSGEEQAERGVFPRVLWLATDARRVALIAGLVNRLYEADRALFAVTQLDKALAFVLPPEQSQNTHFGDGHG